MKKFVAIECLRAWMAWWIVIVHAIALSGLVKTGFSGIPGPVLSFLSGGVTAVNVFIIVSGFVITHLLLTKHESYGKYITRRFFRLFPIYLFCLFMAILLKDFYVNAYVHLNFASRNEMRIERLASESKYFVEHLIAHMTLLHSAIPDQVLPHSSSAFLAVAWSLSLEWQFYLVAPLLIAMILRFKDGAYWMVAGVLVLKVALLSQHMLSWQYRGFLPLAMDYFLIGILSRLAFDKLVKHQSYFELLAMGGILILVADRLAVGIWSVFLIITVWESGYIEIRSKILQGVFNFVASNPVIASMGKWSYSTYLIHIPIFSVVVGGYVAWKGKDNVSQMDTILLLALCMPIVLLGSYLCYRLIEKPFVKVGSRLTGVRSISERRHGEKVEEVGDKT